MYKIYKLTIFAILAMLAAFQPAIAQQKIPPFQTTTGNFAKGVELNGSLGLAGINCMNLAGGTQSWVNCNGGGGAAAVLLSPTGNQTVVQPFGTGLTIQGGFTALNGGQKSSTTDVDFPSSVSTGDSNQIFSTFTSASEPATQVPTFYGTHHVTTLTGPGFSLGNNGTAAQWWESAGALSTYLYAYPSGIMEGESGRVYHWAKGDTVWKGNYTFSYGGETATSDEGTVPIENQVFQLPVTAGTVSSGASTGSTRITVALTQNSVFNEGAPLIDETQGGSLTATFTGSGFDSTLNSNYYTGTGGAFTGHNSTAWGNIIPSSCTGNGTGRYQVYVSTTCNVTLGSGSGNFTTSSHIVLSGPFFEEAAVTSVTSCGAGCETLVFTTKYAWDNSNGNTNAAIVMQGGLAGQAFVATSAISGWPIAYQAIGIAGGRLYFVNCNLGQCNGPNTSNILGLVAVTFYPMAMISSVPAAASIATQAPGSGYSGSWACSVNGGTFSTQATCTATVSSGGLVFSMTNAGVYSVAPTSISFSGGTYVAGIPASVTLQVIGAPNAANLATNSVPFTNGDVVVSTPAAEYHYVLQRNHISHTTPSGCSDWIFSCETQIGPRIEDDGPAYSDALLQFSNAAQYTAPALTMYTAYGQFKYLNAYQYAPTHAIISVNDQYQGGGSMVPADYAIFEKRGYGVPGNFMWSPLHGTFSMSGALTVPGLIVNGNAQMNGNMGAIQAGTSAMGGLANLVSNSASMTGSGWTTVPGGGTATITGAQSDPFGGTAAISILSATNSGNVVYYNSGTTITAATGYQFCGYYKGAAGGELMDVQISNLSPFLGTGLPNVTTSWQQYVSPIITTGGSVADPAYTIAFKPDTNSSQTMYFYGWNVVPAGTTCLTPGVPTLNSAQPTPLQESILQHPQIVGDTVTTPGASIGSSDTGTPKFTFGPNSIASNQPISAPAGLFGNPSPAAVAALPAGSHGISGDESSTAGVPAAGVCYLRWDSVANAAQYSCNGSPEIPLGFAYPGSGTYTTATSDTFTVNGAGSSSHCTFSATNATAAAATVVPYISAVATNSVTITHVATSASGGTVNIICTPN